MLPPAQPGATPLINFAKMRKLSEIIRRLQTYQIGAYAFEPSAEVARYAAPKVHRWGAELLVGALAGDTAYKSALEQNLDRASLRCEPRKHTTAPLTHAAHASAARRGELDAASGSAPNLLESGAGASSARASTRLPMAPRRGSVP